MVDQKISELAALAGADLAGTDEFAVVDTTAAETKRITFTELQAGLAGAEASLTFPDYATFIAGTDTYTAGTVAVLRDTGFRYKAAASGDVTNAGGQQFEILPGAEGSVSMLQAGAAGDGVSDDLPAWLACVKAWARTGCNIIWDSGYTFLVTAGMDVANDSPGFETNADVILDAAKSMTVFAYGAKIKLKEFTGTELLHLIHNPTGTRDPWQYAEWDFAWYGGEIDQNGYNQNGSFHVRLRDGTGTGGANPTALAYAAATPQVFGPGAPYEINAAATETLGDHSAWLFRIQGARNVAFTDIVTLNREDDGCVAFDCGAANFVNCEDRNAFPTNDQFTISNINNGGSGSQHFAWSMSKCNSTAIVEYNITGTAIVAGDVIEGDTSGTVATVSSVSGSLLKVYAVEGGEGFIPNETLTVTGTGSSGQTVENVQVKRAPRLLSTGCKTNVGCSAVGYMATDTFTTYSSARISDFDFINMCTATIRFEHCWDTHISNGRIFNNHLGADPTKTLSYPTAAAINYGNQCRKMYVDNVNVQNNRIRTDSGSNHLVCVVNNLTSICDDVDPLVSYTTEAVNQIIGYNLNNGVLSNCVFTSSEFTAGGAYPFETVIDGGNNVVRNVVIDGADTGINGAEDISDFKIKNIVGTAISSFNTTSSKAARASSGIIEVVGRGIACTSNSSPDAYGIAVVDGVQFYKVQGGCVSAGNQNLEALIVNNCVFSDFGLDTGLSTGFRAAIGGTGSPEGVRAKMLSTSGNTYAKYDANASLTMYSLATQCDTARISATDILVPFGTAFTVDNTGTSNYVTKEPVILYGRSGISTAVPANYAHKFNVVDEDGNRYEIGAFAQGTL